MPNLNNTGHIPGVLPSHVGMEVRFTTKLNAALGLVQEQKATIVEFIFKDQDRLRYDLTPPGELFRPLFQPAAIWLQVHDFVDSPLQNDVNEFVTSPEDQELFDLVASGKDEDRGRAHVVAWKQLQRQRRARGLLCYVPTEVEFKWRSSEVHTIKRVGFCLKHAYFYTSAASQGQTFRKGVTIDCARLRLREALFSCFSSSSDSGLFAKLFPRTRNITLNTTNSTNKGKACIPSENDILLCKKR